MKSCIVYYSHQGNTKAVAEILAKQMKADLIALSEKIKYRGFFGFMRGGFRASKGALAALDEDALKRIAAYDTIVLASPVWAGKTTPVFNAVLAKADLKGKKVYALTVQADPNFGGHDSRTASIKEKLADVGAEFGGCYSLNGAGPKKGVAQSADLKAQVKALPLG